MNNHRPVSELARQIGVHPNTIKSWIHKRALPATRLSADGRGTWVVDGQVWERFRQVNRSRPFGDIRARMAAASIPPSEYITLRQLSALYGWRGPCYAKRIGAIITDATGQRIVSVQALEDFVLDALTTNMPVKPVSTGE